MFEWFNAHSAVIQMATSLLSVAVWAVYLQLLLTSFRRQSRTAILITVSGAKGGEARCIVSNLGLEPVYVLEILVSMRMGDETETVAVADRGDSAPGASLRDVTSQGPLKSGEYIDAGRVEDLVRRAHRRSGDAVRFSDLDRVELTVAAIAASSSHIVAARRAYALRHGEVSVFVPTSLHATQVRSVWGRFRLRRQLDRRFRGAD